MSTEDGWKLRQARESLSRWGARLDSLMSRPPGSWLRVNLNDRLLQNLDLDEIEVLCDTAYASWKVAATEYYDELYRRLREERAGEV